MRKDLGYMTDIRTVGVIGAGQMGAGIAQVSAQAGYDVILSDIDQTRAEKGLAGIAKLLAKGVEKGKIEQADADAALAEHGLALANLASLPHITIAGAIATATHGSGVTQPSLASAVRSLTHVTADGDLRIVRRGDAGFAHYPVHLGLFGPIVELELEVVPAFEIATTVYEGLDYAAAVEHFGHDRDLHTTVRNDKVPAHQQVGGAEGVQGDGQAGAGEEGGNPLLHGGFLCFLVLCSVARARRD